MSKSLTSSRGRAYRCQLCKVNPVTAEKRRVVGHILKYHTPLDKSPFYCTVCLFKALSMEELLSHVTSYPAHREKIQRMREHGQAMRDQTGLEQSKEPVDVHLHMELLSTTESESIWTRRRTDRTDQALSNQSTPGTDHLIDPEFWELISSISETAVVPEYIPTPLDKLQTIQQPSIPENHSAMPTVLPQSLQSSPPSSVENTNLMEKLITTVETVGSAIIGAMDKQTQQFALLRATLLESRRRQYESNSCSDSDSDSDTDTDTDDSPDQKNDADANADTDTDYNDEPVITLDEDMVKLVEEEREREEACFREKLGYGDKRIVTVKEGVGNMNEQEIQDAVRTEKLEKVEGSKKEARRTEKPEKADGSKKEAGRTEKPEKAGGEQEGSGTGGETREGGGEQEGSGTDGETREGGGN